MTVYVCAELAPEGCTTWQAVTLQVPNGFEVDTADVALLLGTVVGSAVVFWLLGLGIGSVGRIVRDSLRFNGSKED